MGSFRNLLIPLFTFAASCAHASGLPHSSPLQTDGNGVVVAAPARYLAAAADANTSFVLAAARTRRKDPLDGMAPYTGGWNISDDHYLASVAFTAAPVFAAAAFWFVVFGVALFVAGCCYCCCPGRRSYSYSRALFAVSIALLVVSTAAAILGCTVLYDGQGRFHRSTTVTLSYVVSQAEAAVAELRSSSDYLESAKAASIGQLSLPAGLKGGIDEVVRTVHAASDELAARTSSNSSRIRAALETIRKVLIVVAAVMLLLAVVGFVLSICGLESFVYVLVFFGWILVAGTLVLCGTFLLLHNVVGDTCVAMDEWVLHPHEHTALDDILPCVDAAATTEALNRSKEVNYQLISVLNGVISNISNANFPPQAAPLYFNQSGPLLPLICNPYRSNLADRACAAGEIELDNAQKVWQGYVCRTTVVSGSEVCATAGRMTPSMYSQLSSVANVSYGLYHHGPILADLADCAFVRRTFQTVSRDYCPGLRQYSDRVFRGLLAVAAAVPLAVVLWAVYSRERRRRGEAKEAHVAPYEAPVEVEEKALLASPMRPYRTSA